MNNEKLEIKIELENKEKVIEEIINVKKEIITFNKKTDIKVIIVGFLTLIAVCYYASLKDKLGVIDVLTISIITTTLYRTILDALKTNSDNKKELYRLNLLKNKIQNDINEDN